MAGKGSPIATTIPSLMACRHQTMYNGRASKANVNAHAVGHDLAKSIASNDNAQFYQSQPSTRDGVDSAFPYSRFRLSLPSGSTFPLYTEQAGNVAHDRAREDEVRYYQQLERQARRDVLSGPAVLVPAAKYSIGQVATLGYPVAPTASTLSRQELVASKEAAQEISGIKTATQGAAAIAAAARTSTATTLSRPDTQKFVRWSSAIRVKGTPRGGILRSFKKVKVWTVRFTLQMRICAKNYTIHFNPMEAVNATSIAFEYALVEAVDGDHKATLWAFLDYHDYSLSFHGSSGTCTIVIPTTVDSLRDAAFNTFLNAVPKDSIVRLD
jgi:hypothetical protein